MDVDRLEDDDSVFPAITPLIDVVLLVLIFFIVTATYADVPEELDLTLPETSQSDGESVAQSNVYVTRDGRFRFDGNWYSREELPAALERIKKKQERTVLLITADARAPHQYVVTALAAARRAGINDVGFEILIDSEGSQ